MLDSREAPSTGSTSTSAAPARIAATAVRTSALPLRKIAGRSGEVSRRRLCSAMPSPSGRAISESRHSLGEGA